MSLLFKALATLSLIGASYAATCRTDIDFECLTQDGSIGGTDEAWAARQNYCGGNLWQTTSCYQYEDEYQKVAIVNSSPGANNQQICWDAFENIIDDCGGYAGEYDYNGVTYIYVSCSAAYFC